MIANKLETIRDSINELKTNLGLETTDSLETLVDTSENAVIPSGTLSITENATVDVKEYESVNVNVSPDLGMKSITENGTYNASDDNIDGYSQVSVNVSGGDLSEYFETEPTTFEGTFKYWMRDYYLKKCPDIVIPDNITSLSGFCSSWKHLIMPKIVFHNNITDLYYMFNDISSSTEWARATTIDVSGWDTSNVTRMIALFYNCKLLETITGMNLLNTTKVTDISYMFSNCQSLKNVDLSAFDMSKFRDFSGLFNSCQSLTTLDLTSFDMSHATTLSSMFYYCISLTSLNVSNWNTSNVTGMERLFMSCHVLPTINVSSFTTNKVYTMSEMFRNCYALTNIDLSNFNTTKLTSMNSMFQDCSSLTSLDLSNFQNIANSGKLSMGTLFSGCTSLIHIDMRGIDFTKLTTSGATNMFGSSTVSTQVPANCEIIVADDTQKTWMNTNFPRMTNVKTVAEYEAE